MAQGKRNEKNKLSSDANRKARNWKEPMAIKCGRNKRMR